MSKSAVGNIAKLYDEKIATEPVVGVAGKEAGFTIAEKSIVLKEA